MPRTGSIPPALRSSWRTFTLHAPIRDFSITAAFARTAKDGLLPEYTFIEPSYDDDVANGDTRYEPAS